MTLEQALDRIADSLTADGELLEDTKEFKLIKKAIKGLIEIKKYVWIDDNKLYVANPPNINKLRGILDNE